MILEVIVDVSSGELDRIFDYIGEAPVGSRVSVPFGNRTIEGFVIGTKDTSDREDLKPICNVLEGGVRPSLLELMRRMICRYNLRYIDVLRLFIPSEMRSGKVRELEEYYVAPIEGESEEALLARLNKNSPKQEQAVKYLVERGAVRRADLNKLFGATAIKGLLDKNIAVLSEVKLSRSPSVESAELTDVKPTEQQQRAIDRIVEATLSDCGQKNFLLHGVTGSGKTLVYQTAIENVLKQGKTAILLVPEISLTPQMLRLMRSKFGDKVAILHSGLSQGERYDEWLRLYRKQATLAVGARSALFAPLENLGLIVFDEEHDSSYVSDSNPRYDSREVARMRACIEGATLVLGSATPDMETYHRALDGEMELLTLPKRISGAEMPPIHVVDMKYEYSQGNRSIFSLPVQEALTAVLERGEQAMIFLNRRGYSSFLMCRKCGYVPKCEACDTPLTYHREERRLKCHHCGRQWTAPSICPSCGNEELKLGRTGTEQVVTELRKLLPSARVLRMDNDTTRGKDGYGKILSAFGRHEADILVGTQMIAKGHDFGNVTLVCILDTDFSLYFDDYRSPERVFQLVTQVAGRAGRADKAGNVYLQTYTPRHYVFGYAKAYDYVGFYRKEDSARKISNYPPYTRVVRVLVTGNEEDTVFEVTKRIYYEIKNIMDCDQKDFAFLGAMKAPLKKLNNRYRYQVVSRLAIANAEENTQKIYAIVNKYKTSKTVCFVEINPQSSM